MRTRRRFIKLSAKGVVALMACLPYLSACQDSPPEDDEDTRDPSAGSGESTSPSGTSSNSAAIDWDAFLTQLAALAETQLSDDWNQDAYVAEVASLMLLLDLEDEQLQAFYDGYVQAAGSFPELNTVHDGGDFEVVTIEFDPGDEIPLHNHPDMTGVILCLSGQVEIDAFDLLDTLSDAGNLLLERTERATISVGEIATLTGDHGNIHHLVAVEYTELLDVFTPPYDDERLERYRWYERADTPYEGEDIYEAWEA